MQTIQTLKRISSLLLGGLALSLSSGAYANTFYVATNGSDGNPGSATAPMQSLHQAIYYAQSGDTILVAPGTYSGPNNTGLNFAGKNLLLMSQQGPQSCILDGGGTNMAFVFQDGEMGGAGVVGFTIQNTYNNGSVWQTGGAMLIAGSSPTIENCIFKSCKQSTNAGGAIYISGGSPSIGNCIFENCSSNIDYGRGGAIDIENGANVQIWSCTFHGNSAGNGGGAIGMYGSSTLQISQCAFRENNAEYGGAVNVLGGGTVSVSACSFLGNTAVEDGGAIFYHYADTLTISSSSFVSNVAFIGGAICEQGGTQATLANCTLVNNSAQDGGSGIWTDSPSNLINCIVYGNKILHCVSSVNVSYSDVQGGYPGTGNLNSDPKFVLNPGATNALYGDLHLQATSPCIDRGTTSNVTLPYSDLDGNPRIYGTAPDMGAYEMQPASPFNSTTAYRIINVSNGLTLQGPVTAGGQVTQAASTGAATQQWIITPVSGKSGSYQITNRATGLVLESWGLKSLGMGGPGDMIDTWYANGGNNQIWSLSFQGICYYKLFNIDTGLLLEDPNSSTAAGTGLDEWSDLEGANLNQQWAIVPAY